MPSQHAEATSFLRHSAFRILKLQVAEALSHNLLTGDPAGMAGADRP
jgi:hypothetical protein